MSKARAVFFDIDHTLFLPHPAQYPRFRLRRFGKTEARRQSDRAVHQPGGRGN